MLAPKFVKTSSVSNTPIAKIINKIASKKLVNIFVEFM